MKLLIKNGRIIDPETQTDKVMDLLIEDRFIKAWGEDILCDDEDLQTIDAKASGFEIAPAAGMVFTR